MDFGFCGSVEFHGVGKRHMHSDKVPALQRACDPVMGAFNLSRDFVKRCSRKKKN